MASSATRAAWIGIAVAAAVALALFATLRVRREAAETEREALALAQAPPEEGDPSPAAPLDDSPHAAAESVPNQTAREQVASSADDVLFTARVICGDDGLPIEHAWVTIGDVSFETNADGIAVVRARKVAYYREVWERGELQLDVLAERCIPRSVTVPASAASIDVWMLRGVALSGVVVDAVDEKPIAGANAWVEQDWNGDPGIRVRIVSDADGEVESVWVRPSMPVEISIEAPGYARTTSEVSIEQDEHREFAIGSGGVVRGLVRMENGEPYVEAAIRVFGASDGPRVVARTRCDALGRFLVRGLPLPDAYFVEASGGSVWRDVTYRYPVRSGRSEPFALDAAHREKTVEIAVRDPSMWIDVEVVDAMSRPIESARVKLIEIASAERRAIEGPRESFGADARTDGAGRCSFAVLRASTYAVIARADGLIDARSEIVVSDADQATIRLVLTKGLTLSGTAVAADGSPLAGISVSATFDVGQHWAERSVNTDEAGAFNIAALPPGEVWLRAAPAGGCPDESTPIAQRFGPFRAGAADARIRVAAPARVSFRLSPPPRSRQIDYDVTWESGDSLGASGFASANGTVEICAPPGVARLTVACDGEPPFEIGLPTLTSGASHDLGVVARPRCASLTGTVRAIDGEPIPGAEVSVGSRDFVWDATATTGPRGEFSIDRVPSIKGSILARAHGFVAHRAEIADFASVGPIEIRLRPAAHLRGRIRSASATIAGAPRICVSRIAQGGAIGRGSWSVANADGTFEIELEPGRYALFLVPFGSDEPIRGPEIEVADQDVTFDWDI